VPHLSFAGRVDTPYGTVAPHCWIELPDGRMVYYRLLMEAGNLPDVPYEGF
jgi:hypothetical protein